MTSSWTWSDFFQALLGVLQWSVIVVSVAATVALVGWILSMILRKDKAK